MTQTIITTRPRQLSDGNPDGTVLGQSATDRIAFYNATPLAQVAVPAAATDAATTQALVNALRTALVNLGIVR